MKSGVPISRAPNVSLSRCCDTKHPLLLCYISELITQQKFPLAQATGPVQMDRALLRSVLYSGPLADG